MPETLSFSIREVAQQTGVSAHTLRYYERAGLIGGVARAGSGHRRYSQNDVNWIVFLTRMRSTGMPIRTMQRYAKLCREGNVSSEARRHILEAHRATLCARMNELEGHLEVINWKIENYRQIEASQEELRPNQGEKR